MKRSVLTLGLMGLSIVVLVTGCKFRFGQQEEPIDDTSMSANIAPSQFVNYKWVSYTPTSYDPNKGLMPSTANISGDLYLLKQTGFTGIIIPNSKQGFDIIPEIARENGFEAVIMGIENPLDADEISRAIAAAPFVDAYAVGHCGLGVDYTMDDLTAAVNKLHAAGRSVTVWEKSTAYNPRLVALCTFSGPVVHPYEDGKTTPVAAANYSVQEYINVFLLDATRTTMLFGVGYPTSGGDFTNDEMQMVYYQNMPVDFAWCYQEAFDQPWRIGTQSHYGIFDENRNPKMYIAGNPFGSE